MIISASRRTDIPAFFAGWFMRRIRERYCMTVNPYNRKQIARVSLHPDDVDAIVFWTKNAAPLLPYLLELDSMGLRYYFQYTINGYGDPFETRLPKLSECIESFLALSEKIGPEKVIWRYDPVILSKRTDGTYHQDRFSFLLERLHSATRRIVVSVADKYRKNACSSDGLTWPEDDFASVEGQAQLLNLFGFMGQKARLYKIPIFSCAEPFDTEAAGILPGKCIDDTLLYELFGVRLPGGKDQSQRSDCGCIKSKDIGSYGTCLYGCSYCYAGTYETACRNRLRHRIDSPFLLDYV